VTDHHLGRLGTSCWASGLTIGLLSGALWGAAAVLLSQALARRPLAGGAAAIYAAPLAAAAFHDSFAALWISSLNGATGQLRRVVCALRSRDGLIVCGAALLGGPLAMSTYLLAIDFAGASSAVAISAAFPALGALLGMVVLGDRIGSLGWIGIVLVVSGAAFASYSPPSGASPHFLLGTLCAVASATGWAVEGVLVTRSMARMPAIAALNIREVVSAATYVAVVLPLFGALGMAGRTLLSPTLVLLVIASLCGACSYLAYYRSLELIGPARAMPPNSTFVLWTMGLVLAVTGEPPGWPLMIGGLVVVTGITLVAADHRPLPSVRPAVDS
jgi:drug/metabolite transporter (DMT)-like permease